VEQDRMPMRRVHQRMQRDFGLYPSVSTLMRWWREEAQSLDVAGYQSQVIGRFSGLLCIDEVYDGPWAILVATDPLQDRTVGYHLGTTANADDVEAFLRELRQRGLDPEMVMTDESPLYPKVLQKLWKKARHALCRFHVSQQFTKATLKAVSTIRNEMPKPKKRGRGRPKKRGRPRKDKEKREARARVWKARFLFVKRYKKMNEEEKRELGEVIALWPRLQDARDFIDGWYGIFEGDPRPATARKRRDEFVARWSDSEHEPLAKRAGKLADDTFFEKLCAPLYYENAETTNNHPERDNRDYRKRQKTFFRMRSKKSIEALRRRQMTRKEVEDGPEQVLRQRFGRRAGQSVLTRVNTRPEAST
jgi:transposase-like protein